MTWDAAARLLGGQRCERGGVRVVSVRAHVCARVCVCMERASYLPVGDGLPLEFADGAASGTPADSMSARATGCAGMRTAIVGRPAVTACVRVCVCLRCTVLPIVMGVTVFV
jgi:hypothetical protein